MPETITSATDLIQLRGPIHSPSAPGVSKGRVLFSMTQQGYLTMVDDPNPTGGWEDKFVVEYQGETFLSIRRNSIIEIQLDGPTQWEFDAANGLLRFKNGTNDQWYNITYSPGQRPLRNLLLHAIPSQKVPDTDDARHSFNLMVKIGQQNPSGGVGRPLAVIIDPDAKNPPPTGAPLIPASGPVPVLSFSA